MQRDMQQILLDAGPRGPVPLWLLLAMIGVVLGSAALVAALAGSTTELAGIHYALKKVCIL